MRLPTPKQIFIGSFVSSILLQLITISRWSFWFDESFTSALIHTGPSKLVYLTGLDVHPPLYYLVLYAWSSVFGTSDFALRVLSMLFMTASVLVLLVLMKRLVKANIAYLATTFAALSPFTIRYAQEARMYAMLSLLLTLATLVFVIQMQTARSKRKILLWALYTLLLSAALYTHYFSFLIVAVHGLYALFYDGKGSLVERAKKIDKGMITAMVSVVLLYMPWLPTLQKQASAVNEGFWIPDVSALVGSNIFSRLFAFNEASDYNIQFAITAIAAIGGLLLAVIVYRRATKADQRALFLTLGSLLLPLLILFLISVPSFTSSYFYYRYLAQFSLMFYAGVALMVLLARPVVGKRIQIALVGLLLLVTFSGTLRVMQGADKSNSDFNVVAAAFNDAHELGEPIVATNIWSWFDAQHYNNTDMPILYLDTGYWWGSHAPIYEADEDLLVPEDLTQWEPASDTVWMVIPTDFTFEKPNGWTELDRVSGGTVAYVRYSIR